MKRTQVSYTLRYIDQRRKSGLQSLRVSHPLGGKTPTLGILELHFAETISDLAKLNHGMLESGSCLHNGADALVTVGGNSSEELQTRFQDPELQILEQ